MSEITLAYFFVFTFSLCLSLILVPIVRKLSLTLNIVDHPGERKVHREPVPCLGGVAIYFTTFIVIFGSLFALYLLTRSEFGETYIPILTSQIPLLKGASTKLFALVAGATGILLVGLLDDIVGVKFDFRLKFFFEIVISLFVVFAGIRIEFLESQFLNTLLTILWIVGITNAFNLLDNMDGLASGVAHICCLLFFFVAARQDQFFIGLIFLTLAGCLLGFLYFNFYPAKIFLGDTGALFIGFFIACISVLQSYGTESSSSFFPLLMPALILILPIFDTVRVVLIRIFEKRPLFQGDKKHLSHRLVEIGMTHREAVLTVYAMTFALGIGCSILDRLDYFTNSIILLQTSFIILVIIFLMEFHNRETNK